MTVAALAILGPLAAALAILAGRRRPAALAAAGALVGAVSAVATLARVADGARDAWSGPGLPGYAIRLAAAPVSALLSATVGVVGLSVLIYAAGYMRAEAGQPRFFAAMCFFVAAMQALVLADDWLLFLVAWELIALASYVLIGFWYDRPGVGGAATRAFVTTRAADWGLYLGVIALIADTGTTRIGATLDAGGPTATWAGLALLLAAMGKSAQTPLQGWLMDAMAGPTPVSALLHSATLVVAGVVLVTRAHALLPPGVLLVVGLVGGVSAVVCGVIAIAQRDLKRMLAASTASQLGLMLLALGAGSVPAALLHLVANAAMKSTLFLGAGVFQHARESTALDRLRGVGRERRGAFAAFAVAGLALAGVPPLAGFWTKDTVLAAAFTSPRDAVLAPLAVAGALPTGIYVARAIRLLWRPAGESPPGGGQREAGAGWMTAGLVPLAVGAVVLGLAVGPVGRLLDDEAPETTGALLVGLVLAAAGLAAGWWLAGRPLGAWAAAAQAGFRLDGGFDGLVARPTLALATALARFDIGLHGGVLGVGAAAVGVARSVRALDARLHGRVVEGAGRAAMATARATRVSDDEGIDGVIRGLVARTRQLGGQARRLQTGLVHKELLIAAGGTAVVLALALLTQL